MSETGFSVDIDDAVRRYADTVYRLALSNTNVKQDAEKPHKEDQKPHTDDKLNTEPIWVGKVTADQLNVRTWAGTEYPNIKSWPILKCGNLVDVCDSVKAADGSEWYYVRIAGKYYGFVHSKYIQKV